MRRNGGIIGPFINTRPQVLDSAKIADLHDAHTAALQNNWFKSIKLISSNPSTAIRIEQNQSLKSFQYVFEGLETESRLYYTTDVDSELLYSEGSSGNFISPNGSAPISHTTVAGVGNRQTVDFLVNIGFYPNFFNRVGDEPYRNFTIHIRTGSSSGPIITSLTYDLENITSTLITFNPYLSNSNLTEADELGNAVSGNTDLLILKWQTDGTARGFTRRSFMKFTASMNPYTSHNYSEALFLRGGKGDANSKFELRKPLNTPNDMNGTPKIFDFLIKNWSVTIQYRLEFSVGTSQRDASDYIKIYTGTNSTNISALQDEILGNDSGNVVTGSFTLTGGLWKYVRVAFETHDSNKDVDIIGTQVWYSSFTSYSDMADEDDLTNEATAIVNSTSGLDGTAFLDYLYITDDLITEGQQFLEVANYLLSGSATTINPIPGSSGTIHFQATDNLTINDTSLNPNITITQGATTINEGDSLTFTITDSANTSQANRYYWNIKHGTTTSADFTGIQSSSFTTSNGVGTVTITTNGDTLSESAETFQIEIRRISSTGTVIATSDVITINNASQTILNSVFPVPNIRIATSTSNDTSRAFDVFEVVVPTIASNSQDRIYIGTKINGSTTFYHDIIIGGVQKLNSSGTVLTTWNMSNTGHRNDWLARSSTTSAGASRTTVGSGTWSTISSTTNTSRFSYRSSTGSNNTGATDGISSSISTAYPVGSGQISQSSSTNYIYREASGSTRYTTAWIRTSSNVEWNTGYKIRVAYHYDTNSGQQSTVDPDDTFFIFLN